MTTLGGWLALLALPPLLAAWWANRRTALGHAATWAIAAWVGWLGLLAGGSADARYAALALTGCASVAVLGARRPGAAAWNFVVLGLLAVLLLPLVQERLTGVAAASDAVRVGFLGVLLAVGGLNYLPTRLGLGAFLLAIVCALELRALDAGSGWAGLAALAPWLAWGPLWRSARGSEVDRTWRSFRDRWGVVWAQRLREQFDRAAANAGHRFAMGWTGVRHAETDAERLAAGELLRALLTRFGLRDG